MLKKELTMSLPQFCAVQRGELSYREIKELNQADNFIGKLLKDERMKKVIVFTIAGLDIATKVFAAPTDATSKINEAGFIFLGIFQTISFWLCLIGCILEILKGLMNGTTKDIGRIVIKYLLIYAVVFVMPWAFDLIKEIFG